MLVSCRALRWNSHGGTDPSCEDYSQQQVEHARAWQEDCICRQRWEVWRGEGFVLIFLWLHRSWFSSSMGLLACQLLSGKEREQTMGMVPSHAHPSAGINVSNSYHLVLAVPLLHALDACRGGILLPRENEVWSAISATASLSLAVAPGEEQAGWTWRLPRRRGHCSLRGELSPDAQTCRKALGFFIFLLYASFILEKRISSEAVKPHVKKIICQAGCVTPKSHRAGRGLLWKTKPGACASPGAGCSAPAVLVSRDGFPGQQSPGLEARCCGDTRNPVHGWTLGGRVVFLMS